MTRRSVLTLSTAMAFGCALASSVPAQISQNVTLLSNVDNDGVWTSDVWGYSDGAGPRTVDSHVRALRRKLGEDAVRTVHGVGYGLGTAP